MTRKLGNVLMLLGLGGFVTATAWWLSFFYEILGNEFQLARECFYWTTDLCSLKAPAALFSDVPAYEPRLLWLAAAIFVAGVLLRIFGGQRH